MKARKAKIIMLVVLATFVFFFSSDFGLIDVEKTSIITAVAIDKDSSGYLVTAQIAVPEATDTNSENLKAQISGRGSTVGGAIKDFGDLSGWFPKLAFCNLIIIGDGLIDDNVVGVLDYFAKSLRVQDSALVALSQSKASELLELATPLDNISAFALQKILLKNTGFDRDVHSTDVKTFCSGHYSRNASAVMPIIKVVPAGEDDGGDKTSDQSKQACSNYNSQTEQNQNKEKEKSNHLFDAKTTALFKDGIKVGELDEQSTLIFNALTENFRGTTLAVNDVEFNGKNTNYLLTVVKNKPKIKVKATENDLFVEISLDLYCKVADHDTDNSKATLALNSSVPDNVKRKAEKNIKDTIEELILTEKMTECDFLNIKEKLYRHNFKQYSRYKDNFLSVMKTNVCVNVHGQK